MLELILKAAISFPFIFFIPGYLIYRAFIKKLDLEFLEVFFIQVLTSMLIAGWTGLILAELGHFSLINLLLILFLFSTICIALIYKFEANVSLKTFPKPKIDYKFTMLIGILIIATALFFHPGENIPLHLDGVVIVNHGVNIAKTGDIVAYDLIFDEVSSKSTFYDMRRLSLYQGLQFPGFGFYFDPESSLITFQYLDFYPILLAIFYSVLNLELFLYLTPIIALLAVTSVFIAAKHMFSWKVGILSAFFLTINFAQIWFARYPGAEMLTQLLTFSGVFAIALLVKYKKPFFAFFSALIFGTLLLVRIDSLFAAVSIALFLILLQSTDKFRSKVTCVFSATFLLVTFLSIVHIYFFDKAYFSDQFIYLPRVIYGTRYRLPLTNILAIYAFPSVLLAASYLVLDRIKVRPIWRWHIPHINSKILRSLGILLITASFIALYIKSYPFSGGLIGREQTLLILQWFLTSIGLFLSIIGLIMIVNDYLLRPDVLSNERSLSILCLIMIAIPHVALFVFISLSNQPVFPWGFRRHMSVIFPFFIICISYAILKLPRISIRKPAILGKLKFKRNFGKIASGGLVLLLVLPMIHMNLSSGILTHREFEGLIEQTENFASYFDQESIILFYPITYATATSVPLKYIFNRNAILIPKLEVDDNFLSQVGFWIGEGKPVYIVSKRPSEVYATSLSENFSIIYYFSFQFSFPKMEYAHNPPIGSKPYGNIIQIRELLHIFTIEKKDSTVAFVDLFWKDVYTTLRFVQDNKEKVYMIPDPKNILSFTRIGVFEINGDARMGIYQRPYELGKTYLIYEGIDVPPGAYLDFAVAMLPAVWSTEKGDGVLFEIKIDDGAEIKTVFSKYIDPKHIPSERKWNDFTIDLSQYAGKVVSIDLIVSPGNNTLYDWAVWGDPKIIVR